MSALRLLSLDVLPAEAARPTPADGVSTDTFQLVSNTDIAPFLSTLTNHVKPPRFPSLMSIAKGVHLRQAARDRGWMSAAHHRQPAALESQPQSRPFAASPLALAASAGNPAPQLALMPASNSQKALSARVQPNLLTNGAYAQAGQVPLHIAAKLWILAEDAADSDGLAYLASEPAGVPGWRTVAGVPGFRAGYEAVAATIMPGFAPPPLQALRTLTDLANLTCVERSMLFECVVSALLTINSGALLKA